MLSKKYFYEDIVWYWKHTVKISGYLVLNDINKNKNNVKAFLYNYNDKIIVKIRNKQLFVKKLKN